jgi:hypothetical protein
MRSFVEEYRTIDKSDWGDGPWSDEPDKVVWVDETTNLDCMAVRNHSGAWCGYVGVPGGHRAFNRDYEDLPVVCHGGLTYSNFCQPVSDPSHGICHIPQKGRSDVVWWVGFDCHHFMDYAPAFAQRMRELAKGNDDFLAVVEQSETLHGQRMAETYRDLEYVVSEVTQLAEQLAKIPPTK